MRKGIWDVLVLGLFLSAASYAQVGGPGTVIVGGGGTSAAGGPATALQSPVVIEGTADAFEGNFTFVDPTADWTWAWGATGNVAIPGMIQFGGVTNAFSAIKPESVGGSTGLSFRLADDSGYSGTKAVLFRVNGDGASMNAAGFLLQRGITILGSTAASHGGVNPLTWETGLYSPSAGVWTAIGSSGSIPGAILQSEVVEANTAGSGAPAAVARVDSGKLLTNEGSSVMNYRALSSAVAGDSFWACVQDADGLRIVASTGDTIRVIDKVTASAGYIESTAIGSCVFGVALNATEWFSTEIHGTWTDGTFTYDDTSLTTP